MTARLKVPPPPAVVVPRLVTPSSNSTVAPASARPVTVGVVVATVLPPAGVTMLGATGAVVSMVTVRIAEVMALAVAVKPCTPCARTGVV